MPASLAKIAANTASVNVPVDDDFVTVVYYPGRVTERMFRVMIAIDTMTPESFEQTFVDFNQMLAGLIKSWDLYEDAEETIPFPVDVARFPEIALGFRSTVFYTILADMRPEAGAPVKAASQNGNSLH
jgi:hypothetical protein